MFIDYETVAYLICSHYSSLSGGPDIHLGLELLEKDQNIEKREKARLFLHFLNNNDPVFFHPAFRNQYFGPSF